MDQKLTRPTAESTLLAVIDVQERLLPAMEAGQQQRLVDNLVRLGSASSALGLDVLITEQYPRGLGSTVEPVRTAFAAEIEALPKVTFDAFADDQIRARLDASGAKTVIVAGMETHICVFQTVRGLVERGHQVLLLSDGVASRTTDNHRVGLDLCRQAGALVTSTEAVLFDLLGQAGGDAFKTISKLVR